MSDRASTTLSEPDAAALWERREGTFAADTGCPDAPDPFLALCTHTPAPVCSATESHNDHPLSRFPSGYWSHLTHTDSGTIWAVMSLREALTSGRLMQGPAPFPPEETNSEVQFTLKNTLWDQAEIGPLLGSFSFPG